MIQSFQDTIIALATAPGVGAIAVIRLSGSEAIARCNVFFKGKDLTKIASHSAHFGTIRNEADQILDEVLVTVFKGPHSFTREDVIEISTHGSPYIIKQVLQLFLRNGVRHAKPGEFTQRAFLNGQFDLAQAEAVADLIASDNEASHRAALNQMRGGFSFKIKNLREKLIHFASMVELELDFGEEDVEFADRDDLRNLINELLLVINQLIDSFSMGNVIKEGIPIVIAGKPNAGKSTLLNALLNEEKAIVSDIPGTTRDVIEDELILEGVKFRFVDTAGLRETTDKVEAIGVERTKEQMNKAAIVVYLFDLDEKIKSNGFDLESVKKELKEITELGIPNIMIGNKLDKVDASLLPETINELPVIYISAKEQTNVDQLQQALLDAVNLDQLKTGDTVVTNARHYQGLLETKNSLESVIRGLQDEVTGDFLAMDIRQSLHYLGEITGEITTEDLLDNIFSKFCIGK